MTRKLRIASNSATHKPAMTRRRIPSPPLRVISMRRPACPFKAFFPSPASLLIRAFSLLFSCNAQKHSRSRNRRKVAESRGRSVKATQQQQVDYLPFRNRNLDLNCSLFELFEFSIQHHLEVQSMDWTNQGIRDGKSHN